jgi:hypothetical protein
LLSAAPAPIVLTDVCLHKHHQRVLLLLLLLPLLLLLLQVAVLVSAGYGTSNDFGYTDITGLLYGNCQGSSCSFNVVNIAAAQVSSSRLVIDMLACLMSVDPQHASDQNAASMAALMLHS